MAELAPHVLGALVRRYRDFDGCEDAVAEALLAATNQWPTEGVPDDPRAWLITVAARRFIDGLRSERARRNREQAAAALELSEQPPVAEQDDTLTLLLHCAHPALSGPSQVALTLRAVGGLSTAEIARAFLVPESTMAQRISRAKQQIKRSGARFAPPPQHEHAERLAAVRQVLYLIFNEGYTASAGAELARVELSTEAIRLTRTLHTLLPEDDEVAGLLALMLLTDARRPARTDDSGALVPLREQDRTRWDRTLIAEGTMLVAAVLASGAVGPFQLQAAIAAVHAEAPSTSDTDWAQIEGLYAMLGQLAPNPMVTLNHAVAVAMTTGPHAGLAMLDTVATDGRLAGHHRLAAVRAHLLEQAGDPTAAAACYREAAAGTASTPEREYLLRRAAEL